MVKIYGCSDDLVEIEGSSYYENEIDCFDRDVMIEFTDGTVIRVGYQKKGLGVWYIEVEKTGTAPYTLELCDDEDALIYSDIFEIDAEISSHKVIRKARSKYEMD